MCTILLPAIDQNNDQSYDQSEDKRRWFEWDDDKIDVTEHLGHESSKDEPFITARLLDNQPYWQEKSEICSSNIVFIAKCW